MLPPSKASEMRMLGDNVSRRLVKEDAALGKGTLLFHIEDNEKACEYRLEREAAKAATATAL